MKFIRSFPEIWASTRWPFSSSTANIVFGSGSTTVPSTSIASRLATGAGGSLSHTECRPAGADTRTRSVSNSHGSDNDRRIVVRTSDRGQDLRSGLGGGDRVLEVGREGAVGRDHRPVVGLHEDVVATEREH